MINDRGEMIMDTNYTVSQRTQANSRRTNRRSLLASVAAGIAALTSLPARAHDGRHEIGAKKRSFADLKTVRAESRVDAIHYVLGAYRVWTADGKCTEFEAADLRFAIDSSSLGPYSGSPIILPAGYGDDRALVFFSAPHEIAAFIKADV